MLHDRVEDISCAYGATIRYMVTALSKKSLQTTLTALEQFCALSVELHRHTIKCVCGALLAARTDERVILAAKLVSSALTKPTGMTLVATAFDETPSPVSKELLLSLLTDDLKLPPTKQMQMAMALVVGGCSAVKGAATELLEEFSIPPAVLRDDDGSARAAVLLSRQVGAVPSSLDSQLGPICSTTTLPRRQKESPSRVSVAGVLQELGTGCVTTLADSRELLSIFPHAFTERDAAEVLGFFASAGTAVNDNSTYTSLMTASGKASPKSLSGNSSLVNAMPLLDALSESSDKKFDWDLVMRELDDPDAAPFRTKHISVIFDAYHRFQPENEYPSVILFLGRWENTSRQRALLEYILRHPDKVSRKSLTFDAPAVLLPITKPPGITAAEMDLWRSIAFMEAAVHVASRERDFDSEVLRPTAEKLAPLFLRNLFLGNFTGTIKHMICIKHLLKSHCPSLDPIAQYVLPVVEKGNQLSQVIGLLSELTMTSPERTIDVLQMVLERKWIIRHFLTRSGCPRLVTAIAICMDEAGESSDMWLKRALEGKIHFRASSTENRFATAMCIVEVAEMLLEKDIYTASATAALNALLASPLKEVMRTVVDCAKALLATTDSFFPEDVENEATEFFKKMYADGFTNNTIAAIELLLKSSVARDKQLYACIVSIMFDESSAIGYYPRKELQLFAELYGRMIAKELLPPNQQQRAWGLLLPAIAKPSNYATEEYGIIALEQIKSRLPDWPQYGRALRHVKDLDFRVPGIMAAINRGIKQDETAKSGSPVVETPDSPTQASSAKQQSSSKNLPSIDPAIVSATTAGASSESAVESRLHTLDIGVLVTNNTITAPPRVIQEQINFLIGNTDVNNLEANAVDLSQLLRPEYYEYFADYLVVKRAALEPNYHSMYLDLVSKLHSKDLDRAIRTATIAAVHRLLLSEKISGDSSERILLRNLGSWLGSITLEKSIPILQQDLHLKSLVLKGMREGKLVAVVALVTRVMNSCAKSRFFCCPNPWTMAQLSLLIEMYNLPHLKLTLRFEVEVLCKKLDVTLQDVAQYVRMHPSHSTTSITLTDIYREMDISKSPDFHITEGDAAIQEDLQTSPPPTAHPQQSQGMRGAARPLQASAEPFQPKESVHASNASMNVQSILSKLDRPRRPPILITKDTVHIPSEYAALMGPAMDDVREGLARKLIAVVEEACKYSLNRSVLIATRTTERIVKKDFARDAAVENMLLAGDGMSRSLASSLSFVMAREELPLFLNHAVTSFVDWVLTPNTPQEQKALVVGALVSSNEELCKRAIEYRAGEEAAQATGKLLIDAAVMKAEAVMHHEPLQLPQDQIEAAELIHVMGEGLVPSGRMPAPQMDVYKDFYNCLPPTALFNTRLRSVEEAVTRYYATENAPVLSVADINTKVIGDDNFSFVVMCYNSVAGLISPESASYYISPIFTKLMALAVSMERITSEANNSMKTSQQSAAAGVDGYANRPEAVGNIRTLRTATLLHEIYLSILRICRERGGEVIADELTRLYLRHEHCYSFSKLTTDLIRIKVISYAPFDEALAKSLDTGVSNFVAFAGDVITDVIIKGKIVASKDMRRTLLSLDAIAKARAPRVQAAAPAHVPPSCVTEIPLSRMVPAHITKLVVPCAAVGVEEGKPFQEEVAGLMKEWIDVWTRKNHRHPDERNPSVEFVRTLQQHGMLDTSYLHKFLGLGVRYCVEYYANATLEFERADPALNDGLLVGTKPGCPPAYRTPHNPKAFIMCDGFVDLVMVLLRCCSLRAEAPRDQRAETTLLKRVLDVLARVLTEHHEYIAKVRPMLTWELPSDTQFIPVFQQQPYVRLLSNLMISIHRLENSGGRAMADDVTVAFLHILHRLTPLNHPAFAFGWLELVAHRFFIPRCMQQESMWGRYTELLIDAMHFIEFLIQGNAISPNGLVFYKAVFKLILVLLHDFPQFLITQHYPLCDAIPLECVQMLNTVLCSFPPEHRLPEPFQHMEPGDPAMLRPIDTTVQEARIQVTFEEHNFDSNTLMHLNTFVSVDGEPAHENVLAAVLAALSNPQAKRSLINAVVLHVGLVYLRSHDQKIQPNFGKSNAMHVYRHLCSRLNTRHRYYFLCACANHLRYPNLQTNYFEKVIFNLFTPDASIDAHTQTCIQEQITRVVAEKTVIMQPHPWGVLNTFVELMRDSSLNFWDKPFIHHPMLEGIFSKLRRTVEARNSNVNNNSNAVATAGSPATGAALGMGGAQGPASNMHAPQQQGRKR